MRIVRNRSVDAARPSIAAAVEPRGLAPIIANVRVFMGRTGSQARSLRRKGKSPRIFQARFCRAGAVLYYYPGIIYKQVGSNRFATRFQRRFRVRAKADSSVGIGVSISSFCLDSACGADRTRSLTTGVRLLLCVGTDHPFIPRHSPEGSSTGTNLDE